MNLRSHRGRPWLSAFGRRTSLDAYLLIECLVYISVLFLLLGAGYVALDRCIDHSVVLRRTADDISNALHAGERWRADVRAANGNIRLENKDGEQLVYLTTPRGKRTYLHRSRDLPDWRPYHRRRRVALPQQGRSGAVEKERSYRPAQKIYGG